MKKLSLIIAGAAIVGFAGFAGMASAETPAPEGNAYGVNGCDSSSSPNASNPGKWLQGLKNNETT